jgi:hypothetical protein
MGFNSGLKGLICFDAGTLDLHLENVYVFDVQVQPRRYSE